MTRRGLMVCLGAMVVAAAETGWGQRAWNWRVYKAVDGMPEAACSSVTVTAQGKILAKHRTRAFISELDGYAVHAIPTPSASNGRVCESPSGQLWTVAPEGLQEFREGGWVSHPVAEIASALAAQPARSDELVRLWPVRQDRVLFLLPDRLMEYNAEKSQESRALLLRASTQTKLKSFSDLVASRDGGLWVAGFLGLAKATGPLRNLKPELEWRDFVIPQSLGVQNLTTPCEDEAGVTAMGESTQTHEKVIVHFDGKEWSAQEAGKEKIQQGWRGPDKTLWAITGEALFQADGEGGELAENEEISARHYYDAGVEPGGSFWLATSDGLFRFSPLSWRSPKPLQKINSLIHCLTGDPEGRLWFLAGGELHRFQGERHDAFPLSGSTLRNLPSAHALYRLKNGKLVVEAANQLVEFDPASQAFRTISSEQPNCAKRALGLLKDGSLCVQTICGDSADQDLRLETYDGIAFHPFADAPAERSLGVNVAVVFAAQNGDLWLGGERGTAWFHEKKWKTFSSTDDTTPEGALAFAESMEGKIWCATLDRVWEFDGRNWAVVRRGFDRINVMIRGRDGSFWIGSNSGLYRFIQGAWVENGIEEGLAGSSIRDIYEDGNGHIWAGTTHGLSLYHPEADPDPPQTSIQSLSEQERNFPEGGAITMVFNGQDKWKFTPRGRLLFSYRLDEHEWTPFAEGNGVSFTDLSAGKHYFQVRAMDRNCNIDPKPAKMDFAVILPWYREERLMLISLAALGVVLFFAALAFNRHRQLVRSYAEVEKKVTERTKQLELANRELLHSQKMNALGTLAAGIAHDFNNILSIVKGSAQIIEENLDNPAKVTTRVERIKTVVEQGAGIVKAMLGFSRDSDEPAGFCDVNAAAAETMTLLGDRFLREVQVTFEPSQRLPEVAASKDFIQQILLNFIFNASESMAKRKQVVLGTRSLDKLPADLILVPAKAETYVSLSVRDFGCGIPPENLARIFEPFFTTKALSARRGTGLGLSMVYELAKKMKAGLAVESVVDQGSVFTLVLPARALKEGSIV